MNLNTLTTDGIEKLRRYALKQKIISEYEYPDKAFRKWIEELDVIDAINMLARLV